MSDPSIAASDSNGDFLHMVHCIPAIVVHRLIPMMMEEYPMYVAAARGFPDCSNMDIPEYTATVLHFWASHHNHFPTLARAARIVFALTPNSAACERVFSAMNNFFGSRQNTALIDQIETSLMLHYNNRV